MKKLTVVILCLLMLSCAKVETASNENAQTNSNKTVVVSPTNEQTILLKPITPKIKLNAKQQKYLDKSLPPKVREILEKAEKFEILAEVEGQKGYVKETMDLEPTRIVKVSSEKDKQTILEAFYHDAARQDPPAVCFEPHHEIVATYQGKRVEILICFSCSRYFVKTDSGEVEGTIVRENRKSEELFNQIVQNQSVELNK